METQKKMVKKTLRHKLIVLIDAFLKSNTTTETKKIHKAVREASKMIAKAITQSLKEKKLLKKEPVKSVVKKTMSQKLQK